MSDTAILEVTNLHKEYRIFHQAVPVLKGLALTIKRGEILAILGPSGVGKSTLLNLLGLLDSPTQGSIAYRGKDEQFYGRDLAALTLTEKAAVRNRLFGFVFQFYHLLPDLTVRENVLLPAMIQYSRGEFHRRKEKLVERARDLIEKVGLLERQDFPPTRLSGGERQRTAIARALFNEPEVVYCDEPTGNLDSQTGEKIHQLVLELNRQTGTSFVLVTHDHDLAALAHRRLHMKDGRFEDSF
ncbi:MAG: ABC transporter ATP-binding protein [Planctomycetes bacterium]|nr:ABC transporter ATP-binding protein [Planctomycetota bacterium]